MRRIPPLSPSVTARFDGEGKRNGPRPSWTDAFAIELDRETDGRWIVDIPAIPGVLAYGDSPEDAQKAAKSLAVKVLADMFIHDELRLLPDDV